MAWASKVRCGPATMLQWRGLGKGAASMEAGRLPCSTAGVRWQETPRLGRNATKCKQSCFFPCEERQHSLLMVRKCQFSNRVPWHTTFFCKRSPSPSSCTTPVQNRMRNLTAKCSFNILRRCTFATIHTENGVVHSVMSQDPTDPWHQNSNALSPNACAIKIKFSQCCSAKPSLGCIQIPPGVHHSDLLEAGMHQDGSRAGGKCCT